MCSAITNIKKLINDLVAHMHSMCLVTCMPKINILIWGMSRDFFFKDLHINKIFLFKMGSHYVGQASSHLLELRDLTAFL